MCLVVWVCCLLAVLLRFGYLVQLVWVVLRDLWFWLIDSDDAMYIWFVIVVVVVSLIVLVILILCVLLVFL